MMGRKITVPLFPSRIISTVPSQTEMLYDLGLGDRVIGITKFCVHPEEWFRSKTRIGGTKQLNIEKIRELSPDLIIGNKEENERGDIEALEAEFPVWMSDIFNLEDALTMMLEIGRVCNVENESKNLTTQIMEKANNFTSPFHSEKALYLIWKDPYMAAAGNTFIDEMLNRVGLENAVENTRYPELDRDTLQEIDPELVLLSSEPYPFKEKHIAEIKAILPRTKVMIVDGEMFSWYGSRLLKAFGYFESLSTG